MRYLLSAFCSILLGVLAVVPVQADTPENKATVDGIMFFSLNVTDQAAAVEWYTEVLGLIKFMDEPISEDGSLHWITMAVPGNTWPQLALWPCAELPEPSENSQFVLLSTTDCAGITEAVRAHGGHVVQEVTERYWATESIVTDPWGNVIVFNQYPDWMHESDEAAAAE